MSTTKPKSTKTVTEPAKVQITTEPVVVKKARKEIVKQPLVVTSTVITETKVKSKSSKNKVIRDSFSFPEQDYLKISELKKTCLAAGIPVKKGELLRAGLHLLAQLNLTELKQVVEQVERVKTGRPLSAETR
jgi:hypothetical protein